MILYGVPLSPLNSGMAGAERLKMGDIVILWKNVGDICNLHFYLDDIVKSDIILL